MSMRIMALGPYQFEALGFGFTGRQKTQRTNWATIPVAGGMDRSQWVGGDSRTETISGAVFSEFGGQGAIDGLKLTARRGIPLPFVDLSGGLSNVFGMQVVEEITEDQTVFGPDGQPLRNAYAIRLRAYEGSMSLFERLPIVSLFL